MNFDEKYSGATRASLEQTRNSLAFRYGRERMGLDRPAASATMNELDYLNRRLRDTGAQASVSVNGEATTVEATGGLNTGDPKASSHFNSLGELYQTLIAAAAPSDLGQIGRFTAGVMDKRLRDYLGALNPQMAATGGSVAVPSDGGFLVGTEVADELLRTTYETGTLASRVRRRTLTGPVGTYKQNGFDESSRATGSRQGGVRGYWTAEGDDLTGSKPTFRQIELSPKKLAALYYATDELLQDSAALEQEVTDAFRHELAFLVDDAILRGDGSGKPLGILNSPAVVSQAKESGQTADTIVWENTLAMMARYNGTETGALWLANRDTIPALATMSLPVGTGGSAVMQPNSNGGVPMSRNILGYPLRFHESCSTLGDVGDLVLIDPSRYLLVDRGGMRMAMSIHVEFVADEIVLRAIYRVDGQTLDSSPTTPYKGSATQSPFITLAARA